MSDFRHAGPGLTLALLFLGCSVPPTPGPAQRAAKPRNPIRVQPFFTGLGFINPTLSPSRTDAVLILAKGAKELTEAVQTDSGDWTLPAASLRLGLHGNSGFLGVYGQFPRTRIGPAPWFRDSMPDERDLLHDFPLQGDYSRTWFAALAHKGTRIPSWYSQTHRRISSIRLDGNTLSVFIDDPNPLVSYDPEQGDTYLHLASLSVSQHLWEDLWPKRVEVFTNGTRGYPDVALRIRLGSTFLMESEPVIRTPP